MTDEATVEAMSDVLGRHRYRADVQVTDDPGWHPCSCGKWSGYWAADFHDHQARAALDAMPEPATVGGVTRGQIVEAVEEWLRGRESSGVLADAILALFPPAPSTVGTVDELAAEIARVAYVAQYQDKEWAERAWADMGGSEPSEERALLEVAIDEVIRPHFTPATTRDVGGVTAEQAWDECVAVIEDEFFGGPTKDMVLGWLTNPYRAASAKGEGK